MMNFFRRLVGDTPDKAIKQLQPLVERVNKQEPAIQALSDEALRAKTGEFRAQVAAAREQELAAWGEPDANDPDWEKNRDRAVLEAEREVLDEILPEAFAVVREAARRTIGQRHYDVQVLGGIVLHQGKIAEMKTGEGKTLVATLPLYLNALTGRGCHLVTVNDYLARVGAGWMGAIYHFLGLSVGFIAHEYSALYDPEFVDLNANQEDQRLVHWRPCARRAAYEADITYGTNNEFGFDYLRDNMALDASQVSQRPLHYAIVDEVDNILIDEARTPLIISGPAQKSSDEYRRFAALVRHLKPSTVTPEQVKKEFLEPDGDFMIERRTRGIVLTDQGILKVEKLLNIPDDESLYDPRYYQLTHFLENALRAEYIYHRDKDYMVTSQGEVLIVDEFTGRPMPGRRWSDGLHQAVEAKEGVTIKNENVTLATITFQNYFRMYTKLAGMTGTAYTEREEFAKIYNLDVVIIPTNRPMVRVDLPDQVYRTEQAKFDAVVREVQEMQQQGRPVLIGTTSVETSERVSELLKRAQITHSVLNAKQHEREAGVVAQAGRIGAVTVATNMAGRGTDILLGGNPDGLVEELLAKRKIRIESATPEQRREAWEEARQITSREHDAVVRCGGLHIIGTERHEARRIDNQLRGRAGRQGDPGSSRFYLSLEDDLLRRFGRMDQVKSAMKWLGVDDSTPIEAGILDKAIEGAQSRVEGYNFDIRKHTVEFDDVVNKQREVVYADRRAILHGQNMRARVLQLMADELRTQIEQHVSGSEGTPDYDALLRAVRTINPLLPTSFNSDRLAGKSDDEIEDILMEQIEHAYAEREHAIGEEQMRYVERRMMLGAIDRQWVDYLTGLDDLRQEIGLQAFAQKDPLVEYKRASFTMFDELKANITRDIVYQIIPASFQYEAYLRQIEAEQQQRLAAARHAGVTEESSQAARSVRKPKEPGRNDRCPCGSGKKYKECHLGRFEELVPIMQAQQLGQVRIEVARPENPAIAAEAAAIKAAAQTGTRSGTSASGPRPASTPAQKGRSVPPSARKRK